MDDNEEVCGACLGSGELMCCETCPAAFHFRCAGEFCLLLVCPRVGCAPAALRDELWGRMVLI